jgi:3-mercaptopyruvate sulfurtransferase SseA
MKKFFILAVLLIFGLSVGGFALAAEKDNPLADTEKAVNKSFAELIPADRYLNVEQFKKVYDEVMAGKRKAYIIDVRSHPEFYAFHIEGSDHVHAGHMYTIPKLIPDPNAEIYIY